MWVVILLKCLLVIALFWSESFSTMWKFPWHMWVVIGEVSMTFFDSRPHIITEMLNVVIIEVVLTWDPLEWNVVSRPSHNLTAND